MAKMREKIASCGNTTEKKEKKKKDNFKINNE